ncbi:MAG TPA: DUF4255 domain-containing protein [Acidimicrobiales bacterium]
MIHDVDASLRAMLASAVPGGEQSVRFDPPDEGWAAKLDRPLLGLFLYDLIELIDGRWGDWDEIVGDTGLVVARQPPVRRYRLSYLVSAWAKSTEEEHRILGTVLQLVIDRNQIPEGARQGMLREESLPVRVEVGIPSVELTQRTAPAWSTLGRPPRSYLELVAYVPIRPSLVTDIAPPAESIDLGLGRGLGPRPSPRGRTPAEDVPGGAAAAAASTKSAKGKTGPGFDEPLPPPDERKWTAYRVREPDEAAAAEQAGKRAKH